MRKTDASKTERFVSYRKQETKKLLFGGIQHATYHILAKMSRNRGYEIAAETGKKELTSSSFSLCVFQMQNAA